MTGTVGTVENPIHMTELDGSAGTGQTLGTVQRPFTKTQFPYPVTDFPVDPRIGTVGKVDTPFIIDGAVSSSPPRSTVPPVISGNPVIGDMLTCVAGTWAGTPVPTVTRKWTRDTAPIALQDGLTYIVQAADVGKAIACVETGVNSVATVAQPSNTIQVPARGFATGFSQGFF